MHVACIRTHLISSASAVSLVPRPEDRTRLLSSSLGSFSGPPSSPSLFYTGVCVKWGPPNMGTPQYGDPGPHIPSDMGTGEPHITRDVGPWGPQNSGDMGTLQ